MSLGQRPKGMCFLVFTKRAIALIGANNIRTLIVPMLSLLMSRGLVLQAIQNVFTSGESLEHEAVPQKCWNVPISVIEV